MNTPRSTAVSLGLAALLMLSGGPAHAQTVTLPAGVIQGGYNLAGKTYLSPANHPFFFAATATGSAHGASRSKGSTEPARARESCCMLRMSNG